VFFFSSRRRHTRSYGDWSSDVCSSDLHTSPLHVAEDGRGISRTGPRIHCTDEFSHLLRRRKSLRCCDPLAFLEYAVDESRASRRSEERRVGKECRPRWSSCRKKKTEIL